MGLDVICIGSATVDKFLTVKESIAHLHLGDKILVKDQIIHSGGGATNTAAALTQMGLKTAIITKLGNDHYADFLLKDLKKYKISNLIINKSKRHTDSSTIVSSKQDKDRIIMVHKDASLDLTTKDLDFKKIKTTKWIYLATLMGKSEQTAKKIAQFAKKNNIKVIFNPSAYLAKQGKNKLKVFLSASEIIILNKEEAQYLLKDKKSKIKNLLIKLSKLGPKKVIITDGKKLLWAYDGNNFYSSKAPNVKVIHTAGAGDAFSSGFLAGIVKSYSMEKAIQLGQANASSVVQHLGTKNKLLTEKAALSFIKRHKIKVKKIKA